MRRCASKDAGPQRGVDVVVVPHRLKKGMSASEDIGTQRGVDCDVSHWLEMIINHLYKGVETFS